MAYKVKDEADRYVKVEGKDLFATDSLDTEIKELSETDRTFVAVASTETPDREGDILTSKGWVLDNYLKSPVGLWAHDYRSIPIFKSLETFVRGKKLIIRPQFDDTPEGIKIFNSYRKGFLTSFSVGFIPIKSEPIKTENEKEEDDSIIFRSRRRYLKQELLEVSSVPVPANPEALALIKSIGLYVPKYYEQEYVDLDRIKLDNEPTEKSNSKKGLEKVTLADAVKGDEEETQKGTTEEDSLVTKRVIPYKEFPTAPEGTAWDAGKEVRNADVEDLRVMCTWYDEDNPDVKRSYKLPHHLQSNYHVVWRGVAAAMAALLGARGGVNIPDSDRRGVYNHLVKHYKQFDKEPPEFKEYSDEELREMFPEEFVDKDKNESEGDKEFSSLLYKVISENMKALNDTIDPLYQKVQAIKEFLEVMKDSEKIELLSTPSKEKKIPSVDKDNSEKIEDRKTEDEINLESIEVNFGDISLDEEEIKNEIIQSQSNLVADIVKSVLNEYRGRLD